MEKLQPVLKQMFWIAAGGAVLLAVGGWWMAIGALSTQIEADRKTLEEKLAASKQGGDAPHEQWTRQAAEINKKYRQEFSEAEADLHRRQKRFREYPKGQGGEELKRKYAFLSPIDDRALRYQYGNVLYEQHLLDQLKVLDPFIVQENRGLVDVMLDGITKADASQWIERPPTSAEVWKSLEDLWLLRSLFESIARVNEGADRIGNAPVRQLISLKLRGGDSRFAPPEIGGSSSPTTGGLEKGLGFGQAGAERMAGRRKKKKKVHSAGPHPGLAYKGEFEDSLLNEEFGPPPGAPETGSGGAVGAGGQQVPPLVAQTGPQPATTASEIEGQMKDRYVHRESEYRTRAFILHVRIHEDYLPALLAELTNSSFPVEIVRVNAKFPGEENASSANTAYGSTRRRQRTAPAAPPAGAGNRMTGRRTTGFRNRTRTAGPRGLRSRTRTTPGTRSPRAQEASAGLLSRLVGPEINPAVAEKGEEQRKMALSDVRLIEVRIAGLLTLYNSRDENEAAEQTEEIENQEAGREKPSASSDEDADPPESAADGAAAEEPSDSNEPETGGDGPQAEPKPASPDSRSSEAAPPVPDESGPAP